jgi:6-phosphofructokinase 2
MVGGTKGASSKQPLKEVIRWGVACGSAATNEGTQLFKFEDAKGSEWLKDK